MDPNSWYLPPPNKPAAPASLTPNDFLIKADMRFEPGRILIVRRNATEPLVTSADAADLELWFSKEPA